MKSYSVVSSSKDIRALICLEHPYRPLLQGQVAELKRKKTYTEYELTRIILIVESMAVRRDNYDGQGKQGPSQDFWLAYATEGEEEKEEKEEEAKWITKSFKKTVDHILYTNLEECSSKCYQAMVIF